jgi:protein TonB
MLVRAHRPAFSWDRSAVLLGVIGLHVGGVYLISVYGGFDHVVEVAARAFVVRTLPPDTPDPPEPKLEPVQLAQASRLAPESPTQIIDVFPDDAAGAITARVEQEGGNEPEADGASVRLPAIPATPLTYRSRKSTDDYYPPVSIRMGEQGAAIVRVCVDARGAVQGVPRVTDSSGHARLDAAAVTWAREALTFTPATENGSPVDSCKGFRVRFDLR